MIDQQRGKGYNKGIDALRVLLVREFTAQGQSSFTGFEIATLIKQAPGPSREPEPEGDPDLNPESAVAGKLPATGIVS